MEPCTVAGTAAAAYTRPNGRFIKTQLVKVDIQPTPGGGFFDSKNAISCRLLSFRPPNRYWPHLCNEMNEIDIVSFGCRQRRPRATHAARISSGMCASERRRPLFVTLTFSRYVSVEIDPKAFYSRLLCLGHQGPT
jgi:hypothetical protein